MSNLKKLCEFPNDGYVYFTPVGDITYNYVYFNNVIYYFTSKSSLTKSYKMPISDNMKKTDLVICDEPYNFDVLDVKHPINIEYKKFDSIIKDFYKYGEKLIINNGFIYATNGITLKIKPTKLLTKDVSFNIEEYLKIDELLKTSNNHKLYFITDGLLVESSQINAIILDFDYLKNYNIHNKILNIEYTYKFLIHKKSFIENLKKVSNNDNGVKDIVRLDFNDDLEISNYDFNSTLKGIKMKYKNMNKIHVNFILNAQYLLTMLSDIKDDKIILKISGDKRTTLIISESSKDLLILANCIYD